MSYEGHEIRICKDGHLSFVGCWDGFDEMTSCHCGAGIVWVRSIDDTNGEAYGDFPVEFFKVKTGEVTETCQACGHTKVLYETTYEIPICPECQSDNIRSTRYLGLSGDFVGNIVCFKCNHILF